MIHILLPVHNRADITAEFVSALLRQSEADYRLVLIDDGCRDDTVARVARALPAGRLKLLQGDGNLWWAGALQLGYEALCAEPVADGDAVLIINDDVSFEPDFLANALGVLAGNPDAAIQDCRDLVAHAAANGYRRDPTRQVAVTSATRRADQTDRDARGENDRRRQLPE